MGNSISGVKVGQQNSEKRIKTERQTKIEENTTKTERNKKIGDPILIMEKSNKNKRGPSNSVIRIECRLCGKVFDREHYSKKTSKTRGSRLMYAGYYSHYFKHHQSAEKCCNYDFTGETKEEKRKHFRIV